MWSRLQKYWSKIIAIVRFCYKNQTYHNLDRSCLFILTSLTLNRHSLDFVTILKDPLEFILLDNPALQFLLTYLGRSHDNDFISLWHCVELCEYRFTVSAVQFGDLFDHYADAWDNYRHDSNALIVFYEDLKQVRAGFKRHKHKAKMWCTTLSLHFVFRRTFIRKLRELQNI